MNAPALPAQIDVAESLLVRSQNWLRSNPTLDQVKSALGAIVKKVRAGVLKADSDTRSTADALTEFYVDRGGDLTELPTLEDEVTQPAEVQGVTHAPQLDYGLLYPTEASAPPMPKEQKRAVFNGLLQAMRRPGGV